MLRIKFYLDKANFNLLDQTGKKKILQWHIGNIPPCALASSSWLVFTNSMMFHWKMQDYEFSLIVLFD